MRGILAVIVAVLATASVAVAQGTSCSAARKACQNLNSTVVAKINAQVTEEFKASYVYLAMANYFARDNVGLLGFAKFFRKASDEEREHGTKLVEYLTKRGGDFSFNDITSPTVVTWSSGKDAVEDALTLERDVNQKLLDLHHAANEANDPHLQDFLESEYLPEQVDAIKQLSDWLTILNRFGSDSVGEHLFDQELLDGRR